MRTAPRRAAMAVVAAVALIAAGLAPAAASALPEPVLHYGFDDLPEPGAPVPAGTPIEDARRAAPGQVAGAGAVSVAGPAGGTALELPGGGPASGAAHVRIPPGLPTSAGDVTLSAWVRWKGGQSCAWAYTLGTTTSSYLFATPSCGGSLFGAVRQGGETRATGRGPLESDRWVHLAVVLDSGSSVTTYVDGEAVATAPTTATGAAAIGDATKSGYLGRSLFPTDPLFAGAIDDMRVYTSALSAAEVAAVGQDTHTAIATADAAAGVDLGDTSAVTADLALPARGASGARITWSSSDPALVSETGAVTRPAPAVGDRTATLTPAYTSGGITVTGEGVDVTVLAQAAAELAAYLDRQYIVDPVLRAGDRLPAAPEGVEIAFAAEGGVAVDAAGAVSAAGEEPAEGAIAVTLAIGAERVEKRFAVTVLPAVRAREVLGYTRAPLAPEIYGAPLANSLHLALRAEDGKAFAPLHDNTGILFAQGLRTADHLFDTTTLREPSVFARPGGGFGVVAAIGDAAGNPLASRAGRLLYIESDDLISFRHVGEIVVDDAAIRSPRVRWDDARERYALSWIDASGTTQTSAVASLTAAAAGEEAVPPPVEERPWAVPVAPEAGIEGARPTSSVIVDHAVARGLEIHFGRIVNASIDLPEEIVVPRGGEVPIDDVRATLGYSDGTEVAYDVAWNADELAAVDASTPGEYTVTGELVDQRGVFPLAKQRADPTAVFWEGKYVFVSTWDVNNVASAGLPLRVSDTIAGLATAPEVNIVTNRDMATDGSRLVGCFWAPDIVVVNGQLQIFFAPCYGTASWSTVQSTVIALREGGDPANPADWSQPQKVVQRDGSPLRLDAEHPGISLDMTYYRDAVSDVEYAVWSQRYIDSAHAGGAGRGNGDADLWIAEYDSAAMRLASDPVVLNRPNASWEQNRADVVEGPFFAVRDGRIHLTYSGSMIDATYATGLMSAAEGADLLDPASWTKESAPVVKSDAAAGEYGPGHSGFFEDERGDLYFVYHAKSSPSATRDAGIRKVFWAADGQPILDMTDDERIRPEHRTVSVTVRVEENAALEVSATTRCVAGRVSIVASVRNDGPSPVAVELASPFGAKTIARVEPGASASAAFATRAASIAPGAVTATATADDGTRSSASGSYPALACG